MLRYVPFAPYADREIGHAAMTKDAALRRLSQKEDGAVANPTALARGQGNHLVEVQSIYSGSALLQERSQHRAALYAQQ
jgi:hypothetical protein